MTGKQRSYLKGLAHDKKPLSQIGKEGISDAFIKDLENLLESHELVKISVLESYSKDLMEASAEIVEKTKAEFIQLIGRKITIYRQSRKDPKLMIIGADNRRVLANIQSKKDKKRGRN